MLLCNAVWKFGIWMAWFNLPLTIGSKAYCLVRKQSHSGIFGDRFTYDNAASPLQRHYQKTMRPPRP